MPSIAHAQIEDVTPPSLAGITIAPATINVSAGAQTVIAMLHLTDNLAGVWYACLAFRSPTWQQQHWTCPGDRASREAGTSLDGTYRADVDFPQFSEAGEWHLYSLSAWDRVSNCRAYSEQDLIDLGFPTTLRVVSSPEDVTAPVILGIAIAPNTINTSLDPQTVVVTAHLTDDVAGV